nr:uncharacterized protein LOC129381099 [Dermacentor andersoni]XP_054919613.1 uncharacterized protein LOC129381099 [Dermacentor andersoni]
METKVATAGFFGRLWQKLFRRAEDAYSFRQPPATPSATASPTRNNGLVEAVDITDTASLAVLHEPRGSNSKRQEASTADAAPTTCPTPSTVAAVAAAAARATPLRLLSENKGGQLSNNGCSVLPYYSVNTDPLDVQLVIANGAASNTSGFAAFLGGIDTVGENTADEEPDFVGVFWQRPCSADYCAQERPRCVMGVPVRLDPAVVCDLDSGPFDRSCNQSVFFTAPSK